MATQLELVPGVSTVPVGERRSMVESALGTTLAEGVPPGPETLALADRYVAGELSLAEFGNAVRRLSGR